MEGGPLPPQRRAKNQRRQCGQQPLRLLDGLAGDLHRVPNLLQVRLLAIEHGLPDNLVVVVKVPSPR